MMPLEPPACHQTIATMVDNSPRQWLGLFWWHQRGPNYAFGAKKSLGHRSWLSFNRTQVQSLPCLLLVTPSLSPHCETWLMWPWHVKIHTTSLCLTSCCPFWQPCCWHWNKTKTILLMFAKSKSQGVDVGKKCYDQFGGERKTGGRFSPLPSTLGQRGIIFAWL